VSHEKLLWKLKHEFNFSEDTVSFFRSYFTGRKQATHTQYAKSDTKTITHGIPQGSTLSTTLFLLYINNILQAVPNSKVYTYADDTTLIITADTPEELEILAQSELNNLISYFHSNNLVPNKTKTIYSVMYPTGDKLPNGLFFDEEALKQKAEAKLLGVTVKENLSHTSTVNNIIKKLQPTIRQLNYAGKIVPEKTRTQLYYSHAYPFLIGNIAIWGSELYSKTYLQSLIRIQKRLIRIIKQVPSKAHTKPLMKDMNMLTIPNLYIQTVCREIHSHLFPAKENLNRPEHVHSNYVEVNQIHNHNTRLAARGHWYQPQQRRNVEQMGRIPRKYTEIWNSIPYNLKQVGKASAFKRELKTYLLQKQDEEL